ncbi:mevalonate kinase [Planctomycetota bacterium]
MMKQGCRNTKGRQINLSVPGRLCLFGEHSDWAADYGIHRGFCIVVGTDQNITAIARPSDRFVVETILPDKFGRSSGRTRQMSCSWQAKELLDAAKDTTEFFRYIAGTAYIILTQLHIPHGIDIRITRMDLPLRKGVSSSAAVCVLVAKLFNAVYELQMFLYEMMEIAYLGERLTGSQCGRMDQACIYGKTPVLVAFEASRRVQLEPISMSAPIHMFFVDLAGEKDTVGILADLHQNYRERIELQQALGEENERIVRQAYQALLGGDAARLGVLMKEAQEVFDKRVARYSPNLLSSPLLREVLQYDRIDEHVYGGKGVGSQGDGTAQFVARNASDRENAMVKIEEAFPQMKCFPLTIAGNMRQKC